MKNSTRLSTLLLLLLVGAARPAAAQQPAPDPPRYRGAETQVHNLMHTKLDIRFDYAKSHAYGKAWLTLRPHFYRTDSLVLDAKGMEIHEVALVGKNGLSPLAYASEPAALRIKLDRPYAGGEIYQVFVRYTAKPDERADGAVASKGLYFINPRGQEPGKPTQVWTQGETEATSVWCPTLDKPNQKSTTEFFITVPEQYTTLSNGTLRKARRNGDRTRTDHWVMDLPHAPYLFFIAAGEYAVVKDKYKNKELSYYVEPQYAPVARAIFGNTPEMMDFFARITGIEYPWQKYAQIAVRDYVTGGMENTTATTFQEGIQQDARELVDGNRLEHLIAHELFHHWFGNYVTAESWGNLALNEAFARYAESLWAAHKHGREKGDEQYYNAMLSYLYGPVSKDELVRYAYDHPDEMFNGVTYDKGAAVLHMLRNHVGDDAFYAALHKYLSDNRFSNTEADHLRLAFEAVTGQDLHWFFNQWFYGKGHPRLDITYAYDPAAGRVGVEIKQAQEGETAYTLPLAIDVYHGSRRERHRVVVNRKHQTFSLPAQSPPDLVNVDGDKVLLAEKNDHKTIESFIHQYQYAGSYVDRREAIDACLGQPGNPKAVALLKRALADPFPGMRFHALMGLDLNAPAVKAAVEPELHLLAQPGQQPRVRAAALRLLAAYGKPEYTPVFRAAADDASYSVAGEALQALFAADSAAAVAKAHAFKSQPLRGKLAEAVGGILIQTGSEQDFDFMLASFDQLPLSEHKLKMLTPFANCLGNVKTTKRFKEGVDVIVKFRDQIPPPYKAQTDDLINKVVLKGLADKKARLLPGAAGGEVAEQVDYIQSRIK